ncbi:mitochondrial 54S ribosomal protein mL61 SCDLUD_002415 [Saccharomycodes ludwigii]|uniref:mitochondrial 54S ribosomal protein mL61 n=1 Tax=Saccharomycodes ludwigii TaxID=36035 RepID=UPI001E863C00|nr:hypothetical protein SCDLUD_002415 [Saccharomycodes ludwigii]KAH3900953.1 hypothetical protein SCDLUD_002415 [Saccharomycodes ludwigii]
MSNTAKQLKVLNSISYSTKLTQILIDTSKISQIRLIFQKQNHNGHMGARKFWHEYLPTLQFYNPNLKIQINRISNSNAKDTSVPCLLQIIDVNNKVINELDMKNKFGSDIARDLLKNLNNDYYTPIPKEKLIKLEKKK